MAQDIISGLFGMTPEQARQASDQQAYAQDFQYAQLDPRAQAIMDLRSAGRNLARPIAGMLGYVDPMEEQAKMRQEVMSTGTTDLSSAAGLRAKGKEFAARGDNQTAMRLFLAASQQEAQQAEAQYKQAQSTRAEAQATRELAVAEAAGSPKPTDLITNAIFAARTSGLKEGAPEFNDLVSTLVYEGMQKEKAGNQPTSVQEYTYAKKGGYKGTYEQWVKDKARAGASTTNIDMKGQTAFEIELAKKDADTLAKYREQADGAQQTIENLQAMKKAVQGGVYSGTAAGWRTQAANFFETLGAPGVDKDRLSNSQQYEKYAKELTLAALKQAMGSTQISNTDREFVNATVPQLETNPAARAALIKFMEEKAVRTIDKFNRADAYARKKRSLSGFSYGYDKPGSSGNWKDL